MLQARYSETAFWLRASSYPLAAADIWCEGRRVIRLLTFGGLAIDRHGPLVGAHIRVQELGLLARLAVAGERGLSRDRLVSCFWPDKDQQHALHSLSQILHRIRKELVASHLSTPRFGQMTGIRA